MINNPKSTKDAPPEPARDAPPASETAPFTAFATLFHQGVERFAELQKHTLDLVASQTKDAIGTWKQAVPMSASTPGAMMLDLAGQGVEKVVQARKSLIDLVVQQSAHGVEMSKERRDSASKWTDSAADMVNETANCTVAAHKILMDFAAEQNRVVVAAMKRQAGITGSAPAAEAMDRLQRNVEVAIQTQKEMMEAATKTLKAAANKQAAA